MVLLDFDAKFGCLETSEKVILQVLKYTFLHWFLVRQIVGVFFYQASVLTYLEIYNLLLHTGQNSTPFSLLANPTAYVKVMDLGWMPSCMASSTLSGMLWLEILGFVFCSNFKFIKYYYLHVLISFPGMVASSLYGPGFQRKYLES